jgi:hypothetical protein
MKIFRKQPQPHYSIAAKTADSITYASKGTILKKTGVIQRSTTIFQLPKQKTHSNLMGKQVETS